MHRETAQIMGMPITVAINAPGSEHAVQSIFDLFIEDDDQFSPFKPTSETSRIASGEFERSKASRQMRDVLRRAARAKTLTKGYFDIDHEGHFDPSGIVKGWSIRRAALRLRSAGYSDFFIDAGGDIVAAGHNDKGERWSVGIRHPLEPRKIAQRIRLSDQAIATSGTYERGAHIYNPLTHHHPTDLLSISVVGPDIETADILATAAFAMGAEGPAFILTVPHYYGFAITRDQTTLATPGFEALVA